MTERRISIGCLRGDRPLFSPFRLSRPVRNDTSAIVRLVVSYSYDKSRMRNPNENPRECLRFITAYVKQCVVKQTCPNFSSVLQFKGETKPRYPLSPDTFDKIYLPFFFSFFSLFSSFLHFSSTKKALRDLRTQRKLH